jgi:hypothetical protein
MSCITATSLPTQFDYCSGGRCFLHVRLLKGLAFTDYVVRDPLPGEQLQLSLELFGQR